MILNFKVLTDFNFSSHRWFLVSVFLIIFLFIGQEVSNYQKAIELMTKAMKEKPDILVLPETMNVGFFPKENLKNLSDTNGTKTKTVFGGFAKKYNVSITNSTNISKSLFLENKEELYKTLNLLREVSQSRNI